MEALLGAFAIFYIFVMLISLAFAVLGIIAQWRLFEKAGEPGWSAIIPVYNYMQMIKIATGSFKLAWIYLAICGVYFIGTIGMTMLPLFMDSDAASAVMALAYLGSFVIMIPLYIIAGYTYYMFAKSYGKSDIFCILSIFFSGITFLIMGFDASTSYVGPKGIPQYGNYNSYGNYNNYNGY